MHRRPPRLTRRLPGGDDVCRRRTRGPSGGAGRALAGALALALSTVLGVALADPAGAHDPIFIGDTTAVEDSPRILDGSISFATYGVIGTPGGSGHLRLDLEAGDELVVELLVPDQPPENALTDFSHLRVTVADPTGEATVLDAGPVLGRFDEPFTGTSYLRLLESTGPALPGTYTLTVDSEIPTRYTLATGRTEQFGTPVEAYERLPLTELETWYATAPPTTAAPPDDGEAANGTGADEPAGAEPDAEPDGEAQAAADGEAGAEPDGEAVADLDEDGGAPAAAVALGAAALAVLVTGAVLALRRRTGGAGDGPDGGAGDGPDGGADDGPGDDTGGGTEGGPDGGTDGREPAGDPHAVG